MATIELLEFNNIDEFNSVQSLLWESLYVSSGKYSSLTNWWFTKGFRLYTPKENSK